MPTKVRSIWLSLSFLIILFSGICFAEDWSSCSDGLDRLRKAAREASGAAEESESARKKFESKKNVLSEKKDVLSEKKDVLSDKEDDLSDKEDDLSNKKNDLYNCLNSPSIYDLLGDKCESYRWDYDSAKRDYDSAQWDYDSAESEYESAESDYDSAKREYDSAKWNYNSAVSNLKSELNTVRQRVRSVERTCKEEFTFYPRIYRQLPKAVPPKLPENQTYNLNEKLCEEFRLLKGKTPIRIILQICKEYWSDTRCKQCIGILE